MIETMVLTARRITCLAGLADEWWNVCDFLCRRAIASSKNSKVRFIRLFGGGAGLAARQSPSMIFASSVQLSLKGIAPTTKQRIPPGRSGGSLPRFLGGERSRRTVGFRRCRLQRVLGALPGWHAGCVSHALPGILGANARSPLLSFAQQHSNPSGHPQYRM